MPQKGQLGGTGLFGFFNTAAASEIIGGRAPGAASLRNRRPVLPLWRG